MGPVKSTLTSEQYDELYHLLRLISNIGDPEETGAVNDLISHILGGGDYWGLINYSAYYGHRFIAADAVKAIKETGWDFSRIVELGAGLGWFGAEISARYAMLPVVTVDKRTWPSVTMVADLETEVGLEMLASELRPTDLIVMCDFLHCIDDPQELLVRLNTWPLAILEYYPEKSSRRLSYSIQIARYGATPLSSVDFSGMLFPEGREVKRVHIEPYELMLVEPEKEGSSV